MEANRTEVNDLAERNPNRVNKKAEMHGAGEELRLLRQPSPRVQATADGSRQPGPGIALVPMPSARQKVICSRNLERPLGTELVNGVGP